MNRRGFMAGLLAGTLAPAVVRAESLMRIAPIRRVALYFPPGIYYVKETIVIPSGADLMAFGASFIASDMLGDRPVLMVNECAHLDLNEVSISGAKGAAIMVASSDTVRRSKARAV